jgi:hypothetical protein
MSVHRAPPHNGCSYDGSLAQKREIIVTKHGESSESDAVQARWKEFWNDHRDFDSGWARNVLHQLSEFLPFVFKFDAVRHGLEQLYTRSGVQIPEDWDWSTDWTDADEHLPIATLRQLPIFRFALALDAYAYYGLKLVIDPESPQLHSLDELLDDLVETPDDLVETHGRQIKLFPLAWGGSKEMEQTITAAFARLKLDHPKLGGMTPEELAALVRLPRKNIVNLLAPANRGMLKTDSKGLISIESARYWLSARRDFRPSIWQQQSDNSTAATAPHSESLLQDSPIFVPVASDGTWFSPNDRNEKDGCYCVASGDQEEKYEDYWTALDFLGRAKFPRWRYRDAAGRWRVRSGTGDDWLRKSRGEIEGIIQALSAIPHANLSSGRE